MTSFIGKKLMYVPFLCGGAMGAFVIVVNNYLRYLNNSVVIIFTHLLIAILLGIIAGFTLRSKLENAYLLSVSALLYTYVLSIPLTVATSSVHYGLSILATASLAIWLFYLSGKFFHLKLNSFVKSLIVAAGFIVLFILCSYLGLFILQTVMARQI